LRRPPASVDRIQRVFLAHRLGYLWTSRFLPELNAVAAGLAGVTHLRLIHFALHATGSAVVWAATWVGGGFLLGGALPECPGRLGIVSTVLTAGALAAVLLSGLALRRSSR
jgi:membrane protein DedA with SNARE-associated domain